MQKWEYAQIVAQDNEGKTEVRVLYLTPNGVEIEGPSVKKERVKGLFGSFERTVPPSNEECLEWLLRKIAELGQDGWEMVSGPNLEISGRPVSSVAGGTYLRTAGWVFWFKRPLS
jgi:hypothetical protein